MSKNLLAKKYDENPFVDGSFRVPTKQTSELLETSGPLTVSDGSETINVAQIRQRKLVDAERFVKVYVAHLHAFFDLKPGTIRVLTVVMECMTEQQFIGSGRFYLNYNTCSKFFESFGAKPVSKPTFYSALNEMIANGMVAPSTDPNLFFVNPAIFFTGDRIRFVTELRRKRTSRHEALELAGQKALALDQNE
jgi:hypothetical protein